MEVAHSEQWSPHKDNADNGKLTLCLVLTGPRAPLNKILLFSWQCQAKKL